MDSFASRVRSTRELPGFLSGGIVRFSEIEFSDGDSLSGERVRPE